MCSILAGGLRYNVNYATSVILSMSLGSSNEFMLRADTSPKGALCRSSALFFHKIHMLKYITSAHYKCVYQWH